METLIRKPHVAATAFNEITLKIRFCSSTLSLLGSKFDPGLR